jgi:integrase
MPQMNFTKLSVDKILSPSKADGQVQYFERLEKGRTLVLSVSYGGTKTWRVLYYVTGKPRSKSLGTYPKKSVQHAREAARDFDAGLAGASAEAGTFKKIAEDWIREYVDGKGLRSKKEIVRHLGTYVYPVWGAKLLFDIERLDVNNLLKEIAKKHGKNQADAVLQTIRGVMTWYAVENGKYNSPLVRGMKRDKRSLAERSRDRILNDDEIRAVWKACDESDTYGALVKMLLLTGQRLRKIATMKWTHIEDGKWSIHTEKREKSHAGVLILPQLAREILNKLPHLNGNLHVFPASMGKGPINSFSQRKQELDQKLSKGMPPWVLHDLRRTARSLMSKAGVNSDIAERVLGHAIPGVKGVYDRHDYAQEKADALNRLASQIRTILNPPADNNVIPLRG